MDPLKAGHNAAAVHTVHAARADDAARAARVVRTARVACADDGENGHGAIVVVFSDQVSLPWLRLLKPGFRHCFALIRTGAMDRDRIGDKDTDTEWVLLDPLSNRLALTRLHTLAPVDLARWYNRNGHRALVTRRRAAPDAPAPVALFTCVEVVKRVIGIHARRVFTPHQLYNYLLNENFP